MTSNYTLIVVIVGVFLAGFTISYGGFQSFPISEQQLQNMINNNQHMNKIANPMMNAIMDNSQMRQQMMNNMVNHPGMMSSIKQNHSMMELIHNGTCMMDNSCMMKDHKMEKSTHKTKQQNKNSVGIILQDNELRQQIQDLISQNRVIVEQTNEILATGQSSNGSVLVEIKSSTPLPGKFLEIIEVFYDQDGNILEHVNHAIHVTQDDETVLKMSELHSHLGQVTYYTRELHSTSPVNIEIEMNGIGMEEPLTGPIDETILVEVS